MKVTFYILLLSTFAVCIDATVLAATGYFAASSPMRNYIISSGFGNVISKSAKTLYDVSGFRDISDQGQGIRKAKMKNYTIAESDLGETQRIGDIATHNKPSQTEDRDYSERLFNVLNEMDRNTCISRLLCEIGAEPKKFGVIGIKVNTYIRSIPPVTWNSLTFAYKEAFLAGLNNGSQICFQHYSNCTYNLYKAMSFLWFIIHPLRI